MIMHLGNLFDARNGRPSIKAAVSSISTSVVIPAAIAGIFAGTLFLQPADGEGRLFAYCGGGALAGGFGAFVLVRITYAVWGFRALVPIADAMGGGLIGFFISAGISKAWDHWAPWTICPLCAILTPIILPKPLLPSMSEAPESSSPSDGR